MKLSIQTLIWLLVLVALAVAGYLAFSPQPVDVETAAATREPLEVFVREDGKTRIREKYIISAPVAGRLSRIELNPGDSVDDNAQVLAVILPAEPAMLDARAKAQAEARVDQARAAVERSKAQQEQAKATFELSKADFERAQRMIESKAISPSEFDRSRAAYLADSQLVRTSRFDQEIAEFELKMAQAAVTQYDDQTGEPFEITAPISGSVLRVFQESATVVNVGTPLVEIGDPRNLEMEIDVLSTDAVRIPPLAPISIEHWGGGDSLHGTVRVVEPAAFTKISSLGVEEQRVNVIGDFTESEGRLARLGDGYRVEARIKINQVEDALQIPNSALFRHQRQWHVFTVKENLARLTPVEIGLQNETATQIVSGLDQGDEVILYPSDKIADGVEVKRAE